MFQIVSNFPSSECNKNRHQHPLGVNVGLDVAVRAQRRAVIAVRDAQIQNEGPVGHEHGKVHQPPDPAGLEHHPQRLGQPAYWLGFWNKYVRKRNN